MATMDPGQRGFGQQRQFNIPDLPFSTPGNMDRFLPSSHRGRGPGGMRPQGPVDRFDESMGERSRGGQIPPELLEMLMAMLMSGQGGGRPPQRPPMGGGRPPMGGGRPPMGRPPMGGGRPPMGGGRPPMGGGRPPQRPPMGGGRPPMGGPQRGGQRPPMGGGRPPVIKIEDLVRAISGRGGGQRPPQADMAVPQAPR